MEKDELKRMMQVFYHRCLKLLRDPNLAMDALQETMTRYYEALEHRKVENTYYYIHRMCTNHCLDVLHKNKRSTLFAPEVIEQMSGGSVAGGQEAEGRILFEKLLATFERDEVALLLHRYVDQMTLKEIASIYNKSDRGMKKRLDRLEARIQRLWG